MTQCNNGVGVPRTRSLLMLTGILSKVGTTLHMLLRAIAIGQHRFQPLPIPRPQPDLNIVSHPRTMAHNPCHGDLLYRSDQSRSSVRNTMLQVWASKF